MKTELLVMIITGFFIANTYYDGKYITILKSWKKYYQMIGIGFAGLSAYLFLKKYPNDTRTLISSANGVINKLPIDKSASDIFTPFLKLTGASNNINPNYGNRNSINQTNLNSSSVKNKRSVSETKKKFVAARQNWHCGKCKRQLPAWFEVDHTVRLDNGGTNDVNNLLALCRDCHGEKTAMENL
ncbi:HNH endonuclease [bacterium]|nr:HNH endonuclease [bacterium]